MGVALVIPKLETCSNPLRGSPVGGSFVISYWSRAHDGLPEFHQDVYEVAKEGIRLLTDDGGFVGVGEWHPGKKTPIGVTYDVHLGRGAVVRKVVDRESSGLFCEGHVGSKYCLLEETNDKRLSGLASVVQDSGGPGGGRDLGSDGSLSECPAEDGQFIGSEYRDAVWERRVGQGSGAVQSSRKLESAGAEVPFATEVRIVGGISEDHVPEANSSGETEE